MKKGENTGHSSVVFVSGLGNGHESWNWDSAPDELVAKTGWSRKAGIQTEVAKHTVTISFDPHNWGKSDTGDPITAVSPEAMCEDISQMLVREKVPPPYVFVGHSIGCLTALMYAKLHSDVVALVLIDPVPDFVLYEEFQRPEFYNKRGERKYDINRAIVQGYAAAAQRIPLTATQRTVVHYNVEDGNERDQRKEQAIQRTYAGATVHVHRNKTHHIHILDPEPIIKSILELI